MATTRIDAPDRRLIAQIGRGGMAEVFLASSRSAGVAKLVVLKQIWPHLAANPDFLAMFLDEARLSALMNHPNIVQIYEVCGDPKRPTIVMEYLHGQSLAELVSRAGGPGGLPLPVRLRIVVDILAGLDYAHRLTDYDGTPLGVVHRDVSPLNVLITYDGHVKLVDFGIAKSLAIRPGGRAGYVAGNPAYMAPDALRGRTVDHRADIFSVGVILWELLNGQRLWPLGEGGANEGTILRRLGAGMTIPDLRIDLDVSDELWEVCRRALAIDPAERFPTAAAMEAALERAAPEVGTSPARELGAIMASAFADERSARERLIERHVKDGQAEVSMSAPESEPPPARRAVRPPARARRGWRWIAPACVGALTIAGVFTLSGRSNGPAVALGARVPVSSPAYFPAAVPGEPARTPAAPPPSARDREGAPSGPILVPVPPGGATEGGADSAPVVVDPLLAWARAEVSKAEAEARARKRRSAVRARPNDDKAVAVLSGNAAARADDVLPPSVVERPGGDELGLRMPVPRRRSIDTSNPFSP